MLYVKFDGKGEPMRASSAHPNPEEFRIKGLWETRWDWNSWERVHYIAGKLNETAGKVVYLATDAGDCVRPRYDIIEAPAVGDKISYSFNGDSYPDGEIVKISKDYRIVTSSTGSKYYRRIRDGRPGGAWVKTGGTWSMIKGHVSEWNREF